MTCAFASWWHLWRHTLLFYVLICLVVGLGKGTSFSTFRSSGASMDPLRSSSNILSHKHCPGRLTLVNTEAFRSLIYSYAYNGTYQKFT